MNSFKINYQVNNTFAKTKHTRLHRDAFAGFTGILPFSLRLPAVLAGQHSAS
jgi:hypothetical protein